MNKKLPTVRDVAAQALVSVATASRVLSGRGYASPETKERIFRAAEALQYKPHAAARSLKLKVTNTIGLVIGDIKNPFYADLADGVLSSAKKWGYHVVLGATGEDSATEREYIEVLMEMRVDGIIAVPTASNQKAWQDAINLGMKLIMVDREVPGLSNVDEVLVGNVEGASVAVSYLLTLGHRRIGIINGPTSLTTGKERLQGYYAAHETAQVPVDLALIQNSSFKGNHGYEATRRLLALPEPPTAILATNNVLGHAAMAAIQEEGLRIPEDISLILFDDVPWTSLTVPKLSVVKQPTHDIGYVALNRLVRRLRETDLAEQTPQKIVLPPELIIRDSCMAYSPP